MRPGGRGPLGGSRAGSIHDRNRSAPPGTEARETSASESTARMPPTSGTRARTLVARRGGLSAQDANRPRPRTRPPGPVRAPAIHDEELGERLGVRTGLPVFASDNISSSAYATEEIMRVLVLAGAGALVLTVPVTLASSCVLAIVVISYRQTIAAYPKRRRLIHRCQ